jgi:hypothetical protein
MPFTSTSGTLKFRFYWNGILTGWQPEQLPNYNASLRHWRTSLTQRRLSMQFIDPDGLIYGSLHDSGTALDSRMLLAGNIGNESSVNLANMHCMHYDFNAGMTTIRVGDSLERLRSARFRKTWRRAVVGSSTPTEDARVYVTAVSGAEVFFTPPVSIGSNGSLAHFYFHSSSGGAIEGNLPCKTGGFVGFGTSAYTGGYADGDSPIRVHYQRPSTVESFPYTVGQEIATSVRLSAPPENCGSGCTLNVVESSNFIGNPMSLLHTFLTGTCCDLGWSEGVEFDYVGGDTWNDEPCAQTEVVVALKQKKDNSASLLSVINKIVEAGNIDIFADRSGIVWVSPFRPRYLTDTPDGTIPTNRAALKSFSFSMDVADLVNKYEVRFGADTEEEITVSAPASWRGSIGSTHTRTVRNAYIRHADDAMCLAYRRLRKEYRGVEHITAECLPQVATVAMSEIQRLLVASGLQADAYFAPTYNNTLWEVVGIKDNWRKPSITIRMANATAYYDQRGWGEWENSVGDGNSVSATSTFGWSFGLAEEDDGTVYHIDQAKYGSVFRWW